MKVSMLLLASGRGTRLESEIPKAWVECLGAPLVLRSARRLAAVCPALEREILLAVNPDDRGPWLSRFEAELKAAGVTAFIDGGDTRQASMLNAYRAADPDADVILVHDAARPFFPIEATRTCIERAREVGSALLAMPVPDTLKRVDAERVTDTVDRSALWAAQTPQALRRDALEQALAHAAGFEGTDDVSLCENAGLPVAIVRGSRFNLKITTPDDLLLAEHLAASEAP